MTLKHRLYLPEVCAADAELALDADRSHYLTRVLRLKAGAEIACFNGQGQEWLAELSTASHKHARLHVSELLRREPATEAELHLAVGWLKGGAMDTVVQKATELGASAIWPIQAERSNAGQGAADRVSGRVGHWQRVAISACEQSQRLFLPTIHQPLGLADFLTQSAPGTRLFLDPGQPPLPMNLPRGTLYLLVGPEGGWTDAERTLATTAGCTPCGLGDLVLRAETAPLAALAAVRQSWGWRR